MFRKSTSVSILVQDADLVSEAVCVECWLAKSEKLLEPNYKKTKLRSFISEEVGDIKWVSTKEMWFLPSEIQETLIEVEEFIENNL